MVRTEDHAVVGVEALIRWRHPERGILPPSDFLDVAETTGLVVAVDDLVLRRAPAEVAGWPPGPDGVGLKLSLNLSALSFSDPRLPERVGEALDASGLPAGDLFLEITESTMLEESITEGDTIERLLDLGVRLAVDDFGTGYSSLRYLQRLPIGVLKVDRCFTAGVAVRDSDRAIVSAVLGLAAALRAKATAEGVETPEQAAVLAELGCPYLQGHLFGRPVEASTTVALLSGQTVPAGPAVWSAGLRSGVG